MCRAIILICSVLLYMAPAAASTRIPGSQYIDTHGGRTVGTSLSLPDGGWAYWVAPDNIPGLHTITVYAGGKYRADTLSAGCWVTVGYFTGTSRFEGQNGSVAVTAIGPATVHSIGVE